GYVETGMLPEHTGKHNAEIYLVLALDHAESQVQRGENQGRHLAHVAVVTSLRKIGTLEKGKILAQDIELKVDPSQSAAGNLRTIVFVQEPVEGRILGAALKRVLPKNPSLRFDDSEHLMAISCPSAAFPFFPASFSCRPLLS